MDNPLLVFVLSLIVLWLSAHAVRTFARRGKWEKKIGAILFSSSGPR
jgi:hypothetical protein